MVHPHIRRTAWIAAAALAVFVVRVSVQDASELGVGFLFAVPAGMAAWWFGRAIGLATAAALVALWLASAAVNGDYRLGAAVTRATAIVAVAVLAGILRTRTRALAQTSAELAALREALTPSTLPTVRGLDVAVEFLPAEHGVSGDFYLITNGPRESNIAVVGDVCGHGPQAAQRATFARATIASIAAGCDDPAEILQLVNQTLVERWGREDFLTATCVVQAPGAGRITWALAGHPPPIRLSDLSELTTVGGPPLGVFGDARFDARDGTLLPPDGALLYTDGLLDARRGRERFGEERLLAVLRDCTGLPAAETAGRIARAVREFAGADRLPDDVCILVLRALPVG